MQYAVLMIDKELGRQDFVKFDGGKRTIESLQEACDMADNLYEMFSHVYKYTVVSVTQLYITESEEE